MSLFSKKSLQSNIIYDPDNQIPVIRCSICTGEQVAGFKDVRTGHFTDVCLIKSDKDIEAFKKQYKLDNIVKEY